MVYLLIAWWIFHGELLVITRCYKLVVHPRSSHRKPSFFPWPPSIATGHHVLRPDLKGIATYARTLKRSRDGPKSWDHDSSKFIGYYRWLSIGKPMVWYINFGVIVCIGISMVINTLSLIIYSGSPRLSFTICDYQWENQENLHFKHQDVPVWCCWTKVGNDSSKSC